MGNKHYPPEYKRRILDLVRSGRRIAELAREFELPEGTIFRWLRQAKVDAGEREELTTEDKAELARLRREVAELREEVVDGDMQKLPADAVSRLCAVLSPVTRWPGR